MTGRRVAAVLAVALVVASGCVLAGIWQFSRHQDRSAAVTLVARNYDAEPVPLADVAGDEDLDPSLVWRPVRVRGAYVGTAVLRNRPVAGTAAVHALAVLSVTDGPLAGRLLVVDRGWLPAPATRVPAPPSGTRDVVVRVRAAEPPSGREAPAGQVQAVAVDQVLTVAGLEPDDALTGLYGVLATEDGAVPDGLQPLPRPDADLGPHLSYAFQWWVFAVGALVGAVVLLRREAAEGASGSNPAGAAPTTPSTPAGRRRRPTAEEEEDALLDAAERRAADAGPSSPGR